MRKFDKNSSYREKDGKVTITDALETLSLYDFEGSFGQASDMLLDKSKTYYEGCVVRGEVYYSIGIVAERPYYEEDRVLIIQGTRTVSDQELEDYKAYENKRKLETQQRNRAEYERLKAKFENP